MNTIQTQYFHTPYGELVLGAFDEALCLCDWRYRNMRVAVDQRLAKGLEAVFEEADSPILTETKQQLNQYFSGERQDFALPIRFVGTPFQQSVWEALCQIPFGTTETYLGLAQKLGNEKAIRAVAAANGANALSIVVPCHRIIGSNGELVGYAGGLPAKRGLLQLEKAGQLDTQMTLFC